MKNPSKKKPKFEVYARIVSVVSCEVVDVDTLEDALEFSRSLKAEDFITVNDDCENQDNTVEITAVNLSDLHYNTDQRTQ